MQKAALYGIIAAVVVAAGVGIAFAAMSGISNTPQLANQQSDNNNEVRVIEHAAGETEITGTPERVVVFSNNDYVEDVLALGVQPVGVAEPAKMREQLVDLPVSLSPDVVDVGTDDEPNLEAVAQLEPDLIVGRLDVNGGIYEDLSRIAPTVLFQHISVEEETSRLDVQRQNFLALADALNRHDKGAEVLEMQQARYDELAGEIEAAGLAGTKFILVETFSNNPDMFQVYDSNFPAVEILESVGLESAVTSEDGALFNQDFIDQTAFSPWGISNVGLEAITTFDGSDVHFMHGARHGQHGADVMEPYYSNPVWQNLEFVKAGNVHNIGNVWMTGGIYTTTAVVERVVDALTNGVSETRTISHAMGETEITGTPQRAIALDNVAIETLLALGIEPVGTYDLEGQKASNPQIAEEWTSAADVGNIHEPNLEVIAQLEPDVIFASEAELSNIYGELSEIAPTIMFNSWPYEEDGISMIDAVRKSTTTIAEVMGHQEEGAAFLERLEAKIADNAAKIEAAGLKGDKFIMASTWVNDESSTWTVLYIPNSQNSAILEEMGLVNAVPMPEEFDRYGELTSSLEGLTTLDGPDVHLLYVTLPGLADPVSEPGYWKDNPVWQNLSFVQEGRVHYLGSISMYGGPLELEKLADAAASALTSEG